MELLCSFDFSSVYSVLSFLNANNPARAKSINLLERESRSSQRDGNASWSLIMAITSSEIGNMPSIQKTAFSMYWLEPYQWEGQHPKTRQEAKARQWREYTRPSIEEVSESIGKSQSYTRKIIKRGLMQLEDLYRRKGIIPPEKELYN